MKSILTCLIIYLLGTHAYVANKVKLNTTNLPIGLDEEYITTDKEINASDQYEKDYSGYIYLDDVVYGLKTQNWTEEELPCLNETLRLISSLQNFTLWAIWEWDSVSSQPLGILSGNRYQLGNFDQCMTSPWSTHHPEIKSQYCLAEVALETNGHVKKKTLDEIEPYANAIDLIQLALVIKSQYCLAEVALETNGHVKKKTLDEIEPYANAIDLIQHNTPHFRPLKYLTWGACVPACCEPRSVERLVAVVLARSHLGAAGLRPRINVSETCQRPDEPRKFEGSFYGFVAVLGIMFIINLVCTIMNNRREKEIYRFGAIYKAFCLKGNLKDLLKMKRDGIEVVYGVRFLTICFIVMCHQSAMIDVGPISNGIKMDETQIVIGWLVLHDDLLVDTFFLISGFLVAKGLMELKNLPSILILIVKRYVRLVVGLAVIVFFVAAAFPHTGSGPLWDRFSNDESDACRDNWWLNLLMLNNYIHAERMCLVVTWYIPCDFHCYVVAVIMFAVYKRSPRVGVVSAAIIAAASIVTPGVINYINKLHAIQLFTYDFLMNPRANRQFLITYIKSHTRAAAYVVGFFAGWLFVHNKAKGDIKLSKAKSVVFVCAALAVMVFIAFLGVSYQLRSYSDLEAHLYAALNRPIWAAGVALLILTCSFGQVPLVTSFLTWYPWVPLSRLAYGVYLVHFIIITRNVAISRNPEFYDNFNVLLTSLGVICVSTFFALVLWLFFEAPVNNLFNLLIRRKANVIESNDSTKTTGRDGRERINGGYIEENLPETVQFSKM